MTVQNYIASDPEICHGQPCFKGTRILVSSVIEMLEAGQNFEEIAKAYPSVTPKHIEAGLHLASQLMQDQFVPFRAA